MASARANAKNVRILTTAASTCSPASCWRRGQELLTTVVAAKIECLPVAFGVESSRFVYGHSTDGVFDRGFRLIHGRVSFPSDCFFLMRSP